MNDQLTMRLARLPEPAPPPKLAAAVMARITQDAEAPVLAAERGPAAVQRDVRAWLPAAAGLTLALGATLYPWLDAGALPGVSAVRLTPFDWSPDLLPAGGPATALMVLGLLVSLAGLLRDAGARRG